MGDNGIDVTDTPLVDDQKTLILEPITSAPADRKRKIKNKAIVDRRIVLLDSQQSTLLKKAPGIKRTPSSRIKIGCLETTFAVPGMPNASSRVLSKYQGVFETSAVEQESAETVTTEQSEDSSSIRKNKTPIKAQALPVARRDSRKHATPKVAENVPLVSSSPVLAPEKENDQNSSATVETAIITDVTEAKGAEQPAQPAGRTPSGKRNRTMSPVSKGADAITPIKETQTTGAKVNKKVGFNVPVALENSVTKRGRARLPKVVSEVDKTVPSVVPSKSRNRKTAETIVEDIPVPVLVTEVAPPSRGRRKAPVVAEEVHVITESEEKTVAAPSQGRRKTPVVTEAVPVPMVSKTATVEEKQVVAAPPSRGRRKTPAVTEEVPEITESEEKTAAAAPPSRGRRKTLAVTKEVPEITKPEEKTVASAPPSRGRRKAPVVSEEVPVVTESVQVPATASTRGKRKNAVVPEQVPAPVVSESQVAEKPVAAAAPSRGRRKNAEATVEAPIPVTAEVQSRSTKRGSKVIEAISPVKPRGRRAAVSPVKEMVVSDTLKKKSGSDGQEPEVRKARGIQNKANEPLPKSGSQSNKEVPVTETVSIQATRKGRGKQSAELAANIQELPTAEPPPTRNSQIEKAAEVVDVPTITQETAAKKGRGRQAAVSSVTEAPKNTPPLEEPQEKSRNSCAKNASEVPVVEQASASGKRKNPSETVEVPVPEISAISKPMRQKSKGQSAEAVVAQSKQTTPSSFDNFGNGNSKLTPSS
ncbi:nucleolar protein dao-5-like [Physella acuta]|uniref:nucleolar protein dao-5-like n=1 Tax=Physella acuta TaxID=109671 RepID=UPI0027DB9EB5|nr:nucleolar protein dao-5-like [Physella acuta]